MAERFFLSLKMERVWQRQYANHAEAKTDITDYIVGFYNCKRINSVLGNLPPTVYERKMAVREPIVVSEITCPHCKFLVRASLRVFFKLVSVEIAYPCAFSAKIRIPLSNKDGYPRE